MPASRFRSGVPISLVPMLLGLMLAPVTGLRAQPAEFLALCSVDPLAELLTRDTGADPQASPTRFTAESGEVTPGRAELLGGVDVTRGDQRLSAPRIDLDREANRLIAEDVRYGSPTLAVRGARAELDLDRETGRFEDAEYYLAERNAQGSAARIDVERRQRRSELSEVSYSTCARGAEFWQLQARELELDEPSGRGKARDITLAIGDFPILYLPYLSFPIDDQRHSGWLVPRVGFGSDSGLDLTVPYYWNIAPERDMTFYPRLLGTRGLMLGAEYRFLTPNSRGLISAEYLPEDRKRDEDRGAFKIRYGANPRPGLYADLLYQYVSDDDYLDDLDDATLGLLSPDYLERRLDLRYNRPNWTALARVQGFQTLDEALFPPEEEPYERLPQLRLDGFRSAGWGGLDYTAHADLSNFDHDFKTSGLRLDTGVGLELPLEWPAGFIRPAVRYRFTGYQLDATDPGVDESLTRAVPIASIDSGLFLERDVDWAWPGRGVQTLEPRLFYLHVPFRDQDDIPLFDTTDIDRGYPWLFLDNRFTGADRIGDANQLTAALASRFIDAETGRERFYAAIGQIHYFDDRKVTLAPGGSTETSSTSGPIAEARVALSDSMTLRGSLQWDPELDSTRRSALDLRYRPDEDRLLGLSHRFAKDALDQVDFAFLWPIDDQWRVLGRWNYSLDSARSMDLFAGFEYEDCCWALRMVARDRRVDPGDEDTRTSIYLQLELKGLANVGRNIDSLLRDTILGYEPLR